VWAVSLVRGRVIVLVAHRVDSLVVHYLFTRSHSDKLLSSQILREDQATQLATRVTKACAYQYDLIWVIVDRLTKVAHFIPVKTTYSGVACGA
jgi:hypothetical protein